MYADNIITSSVYYYVDFKMLSIFAKMPDTNADAVEYATLADKIASAINRLYYKENGIYANGEMTALELCSLSGFVKDAEREAVVCRLVEVLKAKDFKPDFGILGTKYIPRALADNPKNGSCHFAVDARHTVFSYSTY